MKNKTRSANLKHACLRIFSCVVKRRGQVMLESSLNTFLLFSNFYLILSMLLHFQVLSQLYSGRNDRTKVFYQAILVSSHQNSVKYITSLTLISRNELATTWNASSPGTFAIVRVGSPGYQATTIAQWLTGEVMCCLVWFAHVNIFCAWS